MSEDIEYTLSSLKEIKLKKEFITRYEKFMKTIEDNPSVEFTSKDIAAYLYICGFNSGARQMCFNDELREQSKIIFEKIENLNQLENLKEKLQ